jgi:hypothetical protein
VHTEAVLMAVDCDRVQGQLVGCAEDTDGNLSSVGDCSNVRWPLITVPLWRVPSSFFSCIIELLARNLWCTELR